MYTTYLELCQRLVEEAGMSGTITSVQDQVGEFKRVVEWVKRAVIEIEGKWQDWNFLHSFHTISLIVGVSDYPAPADHNRWDTASAKVPSRSQLLCFEQWVRRKEDPTQLIDGDPYMFTVLPDQSIRFYDTPITALDTSFEYWKRPTILQNNSDEPAIPVQYRDIIVWKALFYYANYESADEAKVQAVENYEARINQLESRELPGYQAAATMYTGVNIDVVARVNDGEFDGY